MPENSTVTKVQGFIAGNIATDVSSSELDPDMNLVALGIVTSLSLLRVIAWTGEEFGLPVNDLEINPKDLTSIRSIASFIDENTTN